MAVLINGYTAIGDPHHREPLCLNAGHVIAISSNEAEDDAAVGDLVVGMCYETKGEREFGYWANNNASRFHETLAKVSSDLSGAARDPFFEFLDCNPLQATFGPEPCRELAADFATWLAVVRPRLIASDEMFGAFYDQLGAAYAHARDGGLVLFA